MMYFASLPSPLSPVFARARRMANAKINVLILTHLSRTNIARFLRRRRFRRFGFVLKFEISIPSCFILFFSRVFGQMGQRAEGGKRGVRKMCVSKRELIYLVISSGLLEGKNARNIIDAEETQFNCKFKCKKGEKRG